MTTPKLLRIALAAVATTLPLACGSAPADESATKDQAQLATTGDLVVTALTWTPASPAPGDAVTFHAIVENRGGKPTPPATTIGVAFLIGGRRVSWSDTYEKSLAPGVSVALTANGGPSGPSWKATAGKVDVTAWVDDVDRIAEGNETNNELTRSVTVADAPGCRYGGPGTTMMADCVAAMVGVNTHVSYTNKVYFSHFDDIVLPRLKELGVRHIRDTGSPDKTVIARFGQLGQAGIKTLFVSFDAADADYVASLNAGGANVVDAVEPPNERDSTGAGWQGRLASFIPPMYARYSGPALTSLTFLGPSFADTRDSAESLAASLPTASRYMDAGNLHDYCGQHPEGPGGGGWGLSLAQAMTRYRSLSGAHPLWVSENGYKMSGSSVSHSAVTERAAAKYLPRSLLFHLMSGVERYYIYQLINDNAEDFGLLDDDGSPRQQFTAVKKLIALLSDPGPAFRTTPLGDRLTGDTTNIHSMMFEKRTGTHWFAIWQGVRSSVQAHTDREIGDIEATPRHLTLALDAPVKTALAFEPSTAAGAVGIRTRTANVPLTVSDDVLLIELAD